MVYGAALLCFALHRRSKPVFIPAMSLVTILKVYLPHFYVLSLPKNSIFLQTEIIFMFEPCLKQIFTVMSQDVMKSYCVKCARFTGRPCLIFSHFVPEILLSILEV